MAKLFEHDDELPGLELLFDIEQLTDRLAHWLSGNPGINVNLAASIGSRRENHPDLGLARWQH